MSILLTPSGQRSDNSLWLARADTVYVATTRVLLMRKLYPAFELKRSSQNSFFCERGLTSQHVIGLRWLQGWQLGSILDEGVTDTQKCRSPSELLNNPFLSTFNQMCWMTHFPKSPDKTTCQFIIALRERLYNRFQRVCTYTGAIYSP